jgi:type IV pilus assembly protein PilB
MSVPPQPEKREAWTSLGQMLLRRKAITEEQLKTAFERHRQTRRRLGQVLIDMRLIDERLLVECLAEQFRKEFVTVEQLAALELDVVKVIPTDVARQHSVIAVAREARRLVVATPDPLNFLALDDVRRTTGLEVDFRIGPPTGIVEAIDRYYRQISKQGVDDALRQDLGLNLVSEIRQTEDTVDLKQLRTQADDPPVVKLVNYVLSRAASDGASDIHVEAYEDKTSIRYRIDGLLYELLEVPRQLHLAVISRLKIISRLDIAERRLPQDGSFSVRIADREIDFRVSSLPTVHGEKIVLRLLEKEAVMHHYTLQSLGFEPDQLALFVEAIRRPWGMILMTGPTGSGKSTTLHTSLKAIKSPRKNIITVEDPVEYRQPGIQQVQVKSEIGFDFARSLRAILRQDPDIIMIGEIRDSETAQIAVRAALTGHLVFSTLHTNDSVSTLTRLINIGVEPFLVASAVNLAAAQRLVRKICKECKEAYEPTPDERELFAADKMPEVLYRGRGCKACRNTGYSGRLALYELFPVNADVRRMVLDGQDADRIGKYAVGAGMVTLRQSGLRKTLEGITTLEEIMAVVADQE